MSTLTADSTSRYDVSRSSDVVQHARTFKEWEDNKYHALGGKRPFDGVMRDHSLGDAVRVCAETVRTPFLEQIGHVPVDRILILQLLSESDVLLNGRFVNSETVFVSSGKTIHAIAKSPIHANILTIDKGLFFESFDVKSKSIRESLPFEHFIKPIGGTTSDFHSQFQAHFRELDRLASEGVCTAHSIDRILAATGEIVCADVDAELSPISSTTRAYIVDKSCELFAQNFHDEAFGVLDLCSRLRVSRRTLQYSFETVIGMSPSNYMRSVRLNIARRSLMTNPNEKIQGLALDAGFGHLGRFSKYYQEFFGELPSVTISRCKPTSARVLDQVAH
ncbi:helix-turn-helix domain-containing protein [Burkholderia sp. PR2]|uniref:helix-turn-helix domain-containing protein n=1 Tax=Burkholderia sp. PR2 TaxID=3448078 RepID=UPI00402A9AFB